MRLGPPGLRVPRYSRDRTYESPAGRTVMSMMDGDPVEPGDQVWDRQGGTTGIVQSVYQKTFTVKFGRRIRTVSYDGVVDGRNDRSVFWAPNDFFIPRKNPAVYRRQRRAVIQIMQIISDMTGVSPPETTE